MYPPPCQLWSYQRILINEEDPHREFYTTRISLDLSSWVAKRERIDESVAVERCDTRRPEHLARGRAPQSPSSCSPYVWVWRTGTFYQLVAVWTERVYVATFVQTEHEQWRRSSWCTPKKIVIQLLVHSSIGHVMMFYVPKKTGEFPRPIAEAAGFPPLPPAPRSCHR